MNDTTQRNKMTLEEAELILEEYLGFPHTDTPLEYDYKKTIFKLPKSDIQRFETAYNVIVDTQNKRIRDAITSLSANGEYKYMFDLEIPVLNYLLTTQLENHSAVYVPYFKEQEALKLISPMGMRTAFVTKTPFRIVLFKEFVDKLKTPGLFFILCHEAQHYMRRHFDRQLTRDSRIWNYATDLIINYSILVTKLPKLVNSMINGKHISEIDYDDLFWDGYEVDFIGNKKKLKFHELNPDTFRTDKWFDYITKDNLNEECVYEIVKDIIEKSDKQKLKKAMNKNVNNQNKVDEKKQNSSNKQEQNNGSQSQDNQNGSSKQEQNNGSQSQDNQNGSSKQEQNDGSQRQDEQNSSGKQEQNDGSQRQDEQNSSGKQEQNDDSQGQDGQSGSDNQQQNKSGNLSGQDGQNGSDNQQQNKSGNLNSQGQQGQGQQGQGQQGQGQQGQGQQNNNDLFDDLFGDESKGNEQNQIENTQENKSNDVDSNQSTDNIEGENHLGDGYDMYQKSLKQQKETNFENEYGEYADEMKKELSNIADKMGLPNSEADKENQSQKNKDVFNKLAQEYEKLRQSNNQGYSSNGTSEMDEILKRNKEIENKYNFRLLLSSAIEKFQQNGGRYVKSDELTKFSKLTKSESVNELLGFGNPIKIYKKKRVAPIIDVLVIMDTSGSVGTKDITNGYLNEIKGVVLSNPNLNLHCISADTEIKQSSSFIINAENFKQYEENGFPFSGGGGTDMTRPLANQLVHVNKNFALTLIFSDGEYPVFSKDEINALILDEYEKFTKKKPSLKTLKERKDYQENVLRLKKMKIKPSSNCYIPPIILLNTRELVFRGSKHSPAFDSWKGGLQEFLIDVNKNNSTNKNKQRIVVTKPRRR